MKLLSRTASRVIALAYQNCFSFQFQFQFQFFRTLHPMKAKRGAYFLFFFFNENERVAIYELPYMSYFLKLNSGKSCESQEYVTCGWEIVFLSNQNCHTILSLAQQRRYHNSLRKTLVSFLQILMHFDYVFTAIFALEVIVKVRWLYSATRLWYVLFSALLYLDCSYSPLRPTDVYLFKCFHLPLSTDLTGRTCSWQ